MNYMIQIGRNDQRITAAFRGIEYNGRPGVCWSSELREVFAEEESLEQFISFDRERSVSVSHFL